MLLFCIIYYRILMDAISVLELSQDRKIAALTINIYVHLFFNKKGDNIVDKEKMEIAIKEAAKAYKKNEVPIGCVIVKNGKILAKAHNLKEKKHSALCHAELIAIEKASKKLKRWRLNDCEMYITMLPCPMCASAIKQSRIKKIYYGVENTNNCISKMIFDESDINEKIEVISNVREKECREIVRKFFKKQRNK